MLPGEDEVALVFVDAAEDEVVESAVVDVSEDMEVSRSVDEFGREDESSASFTKTIKTQHGQWGSDGQGNIR